VLNLKSKPAGVIGNVALRILIPHHERRKGDYMSSPPLSLLTRASIDLGELKPGTLMPVDGRFFD